MSMADAGKAKLDLGRVFGDTFGVIRRQAPLLVGLTFVLSFVPAVVNGLLSFNLMSEAATSPAASLEVMKSPLYWVGVLVSLVLGCFLLACQLRIAISDLEGRRSTLPELARLAAGKIIPIVLVTILIMLGVFVGAILLIVPGVILAIMWVAALPIVVTDTSDPLQALSRSRALTRGNRWRIFGLTLLAWLIVLIVEVIFLGALGGFGTSRGGAVGLVVAGILNFAISLVFSVGIAALYVQLRELKGAGGESVAQVFA